jgi:hypothetical protein
MSGRASEGAPSAAEPLAATTLAQLVRTRLTDEQQARLRVEIASDVGVPSVAGAGMVQAISSLLRSEWPVIGGSPSIRATWVNGPREGSRSWQLHVA